MTAGSELVVNSNNACDDNVGGCNGNGNVDRKDDGDYVFVSDTVIVSPKSDSADEIQLVEEEEDDDKLGRDNGVVVGNGSVEVKDGVRDEAIVENGSVVESGSESVSENGHVGEITGEEVVKSIDQVADANGNGIADVEAKTEDVESEVIVDQKSTTESSPDVVNTTDELNAQSVLTSDVVNTTDELVSVPDPVTTDGEVIVNDELKSVSTSIDETAKPSEDLQVKVAADVVITTDELPTSPDPVENTDSQVIVNDDLESTTSTLINEAECQVTVVEPSEEEVQVKADVSELAESPVNEEEGQVTVDESGKPSEDLESQVTANGSETCENPVKEDESEVSVDVSESVVGVADNQESVVSVDESEPSDNHTEEVDSATIVTEPNGKPEVNIEAEPNHIGDVIKAEVESESVSAPLPSENENVEVEEIRSVEESGECRDSGAVLSEDADVLVNGHVAKFEGGSEMEETKIAQPEADNEVEENTETVAEVAESGELELNAEETKEQAETEDGIQESQPVVMDVVQEDKTTEVTNDAEVLLEAEADIKPITNENTASKYEVENSIDQPQEGFQPDESIENGDMPVEKDIDSLSNHNDSTVVEQKVESVDHLGTENRSAEDTECGTRVEVADVHDNDEKETEVGDAAVESTGHLVTENRSVDDINSGSGIENADIADDGEKEAEIKDASVGDPSTLSFPDTYVKPGTVIEFGSIGRHEPISNIHNNVVNTEEGTDVIQSDEIPASSVEGSVGDAVDVQDEEVEVLAYNFLVRIPKYDSEYYATQFKSAKLLVDEKTRERDAIRTVIQGKRAELRSQNDKYHAARSEENEVRKLIKLKRQEIDDLQGEFTKLKNAMSVEDIDVRIHNMQHVMQHETINLKDEKQFIREIRQLRSLRDQLAVNMGTPEEIRKLIDDKEKNEERMRTLRKELDSLKVQASKAEAAVKAIGKKYDEESRKERELQAQFRIADDVRQKAYLHLDGLRKLGNAKNKSHYQYKKDATTARDFASLGDKDSLHRLCANQVETFMEKWNTDNDFRQEYITSCNLNASRRLKRALAGASHTPDNMAPVQPINVDEKVVKSLVSIPVESKSVTVASDVEQRKVDSSPEVKSAEMNTKSNENSVGQKNQTMKTKVDEKPTLGSDDVAIVTEKDESIDKKEEVNALSKEELELAKKAEELKKEELAVKLKEQRRLEEKAKATEALERKKRNAEKAQIRAELRARKEAEQKEKEREKRIRKKEKKKAGGDGSINGEEIASSESSNEATAKETETLIKETTKKKTQKPPPHFFSKQLKPKPIPPPLVNRNRKRWQYYGNYLLCLLAVFVIFLIGNCSYFFGLTIPKFNGAF
ncbi:hypothetical protein CTI12_AA466230 [Artemisia annua]|uniref:Proton pump-interactor 1 n=1 Tax=Artemisia annua TaxID=35608 RepID=A0A2U1L3Z5_ARTAN|nr:hypothetical protein CTI12_AA466230 [Artemisia annua]